MFSIEEESFFDADFLSDDGFEAGAADATEFRREVGVPAFEDTGPDHH